MLSKATKFCFRLPFQATKNLPLSQLLLTNPKVLPNFQRPSTLFSQTPHFYFSNEKDPKTQPPASKKKSKVVIEEGEVEDTKPDFVDFMQKKGENTNIHYEYNDKTIFEVHTKKVDFTKQYMFYWGMGTIWGIVSYLTFNYINPWVSLLPVWFLSGSLMSIRMASKFSSEMIKKIELVDPKHINIYPLSLKGKAVLCEIAKIEMLGMKAMSETPAEQGATKVKSYIILANFKDAQKNKSYKNMRLIIDSSITSVPNIDLLKTVLFAQPEEVEKYDYVEKNKEFEITEEEKKERDRARDVEGKAQFDFKEEEFDELRKQFNKDFSSEEKAEEEKKK